MPTFYYGGEAYTRVGVVSNGYLVVGGGDSGDIVFTPQHFPNAARPNNVIAPLWSRPQPGRRPEAAFGSARSPTASSTWIVVDWDAVKNFGNATTHSFEIWIQMLGGANRALERGRSRSRTAPGTTPATPAPAIRTRARTGAPRTAPARAARTSPLSAGRRLRVPVHTSPPTAGGSVVLNFDIYSKLADTYHSVASMTSDTTPGVTQVSQAVTVSP